MGAEEAEFAEAGLGAGAGDVGGLAVESESVFIVEGGAGGGC